MDNVHQAIAKTGFTANETDTSQDTESSASVVTQEEPSKQPSEGADTGDNTNTRTQTSMVLIESGSSSAGSTESD